MAEDSKYVNYYRQGIGHVGSYQVAGVPYMTGSATLDANVKAKVEFPRVSRSITVINRTAVDLRISFQDKDAPGNTHGGLHYITLTENRDSMTFNVKAKEIYITSLGDNGAFEVFAELTAIETQDMFHLTGSGITE